MVLLFFLAFVRALFLSEWFLQGSFLIWLVHFRAFSLVFSIAIVVSVFVLLSISPCSFFCLLLFGCCCECFCSTFHEAPLILNAFFWCVFFSYTFLCPALLVVLSWLAFPSVSLLFPIVSPVEWSSLKGRGPRWFTVWKTTCFTKMPLVCFLWVLLFRVFS